MDKAKFEKWLGTLPSQERATKAKKKLPKLVDHLLHLIALHANNEIVTYSPKIAGQIPESFAANAFLTMQHALHRFEIVRTCAVWDSADPDKDNIATIVALVNDPAVINLLCADTAAHYAGIEGAIFNASEDPALRKAEQEAYNAANVQWGEEMADRDRAWMAEAIQEATDILASPMLGAVMNLRDKNLAHILAITYREKKGAVPAMKYGDERTLLTAAIRITEKLYCAVNGTSFDFENSFRICRENSAELWDACSFRFGGS